MTEPEAEKNSSKIERQEVSLRALTPQGTGEVRLTPEQEMAVDKHKVTYYVGGFILVAVTVTCIIIMLTKGYEQKTVEDASKLLFIVVGAVLGTIFANRSDN